VAVKHLTPSWRIGHGFDIHRTEPGDGVWLGGVKVPAPFALSGHSDADVLLHAITDAIFGALADHDIGHYFPPSDPANKGRASIEFLQFALGRMRDQGYSIGNLDCNIICEAPRISPVREAIRDALGMALALPTDRISVKGRTHEKVDAIGRSEAVSCHVVILLFQ
jgi:2-C-methyl-D-erythritol 2,4-cyclodiphosphate synthase